MVVHIFEIKLLSKHLEKVNINEKLLLDPVIVNTPVAISLMDHVIYGKYPSLAVVIEKIGGNQR